MGGFDGMIKSITNAGAGVVTLALLLVGVVYLAKNLPKWVATWQANQATATEVIRANSEVIKEVAKSNDNVASALQMLQPLIEQSIATQDAILGKQDATLTEVIKIGERTLGCKKGA